MHNEYSEAIINLRSPISSRFVQRFIVYGNENINYRTKRRLQFQNMVPVYRLLDKRCPVFRALSIFGRFMEAYLPTLFWYFFSEVFHYRGMYFDQRSMNIYIGWIFHHRKLGWTFCSYEYVLKKNQTIRLSNNEHSKKRGFIKKCVLWEKLWKIRSLNTFNTL